MKPISKIITFIVLVGTYMIMPYPEGRFLFYIIVVLLFIKVAAIGMEIKEGFDEIYDYLNQQLQNQSNQDKK
jgi:hypothetical protein